MAFEYSLDMTATLAFAVILLIIGRYIKRVVPVLARFFIPAPVIGGLVFAFVALIGHELKLFTLSFDSVLKDLLMMAFFTSIGFSASLKMLLSGGKAVAVFLLVSVCLICLQNGIGITLATLFGYDPLLGLATCIRSQLGPECAKARATPVTELGPPEL